jgi:hypothetical protein
VPETHTFFATAICVPEIPYVFGGIRAVRTRMTELAAHALQQSNDFRNCFRPGAPKTDKPRLKSKIHHLIIDFAVLAREILRLETPGGSSASAKCQ